MPQKIDPLTPEACAYYRRAMDSLRRANIPFLVGGAYALQHYTSISRHTKDFDVFIRPNDCRRALDTFAAQGYRAELTFPHWLGKVYAGDHFIDLIFSSGNGVAQVDDDWFAHAPQGQVLARQVRLCPPEEMIWSKAFIMERERFDGADIAHIIRAQAEQLDWQRLRQRFGSHWRLLLGHLILFGFVYPAERGLIPRGLMEELLQQAQGETAHLTDAPMCQGTLLSREQYLIDVENWGYADARLHPHGPMSAEAIAHWTAAIGNDAPAPPANPHPAPAASTGRLAVAETGSVSPDGECAPQVRAPAD